MVKKRLRALREEPPLNDVLSLLLFFFLTPLSFHCQKQGIACDSQKSWRESFRQWRIINRVDSRYLEFQGTV